MSMCSKGIISKYFGGIWDARDILRASIFKLKKEVYWSLNNKTTPFNFKFSVKILFSQIHNRNSCTKVKESIKYKSN